jgi:hypothetical protein
MTKNKWYVGWSTPKQGFIAFQSETTPTTESHGSLYNAVVGPFGTKRGAKWAEKYGKGNPHFTCVAAAEKIAKSILKSWGKYPGEQYPPNS